MQTYDQRGALDDRKRARMRRSPEARRENDMGLITKIQWADSTVNPVAGCAGCELYRPTQGVRICYAERLTRIYASSSKGYPPRFILPTLFPGRTAAAARFKDLRGAPRQARHSGPCPKDYEKPWLDGLPRLLLVSDMGDALSEGAYHEAGLANVTVETFAPEGRRASKTRHLPRTDAIRDGRAPSNVSRRRSSTSPCRHAARSIYGCG